ncbi:arsenate reductase family protein [Shouchella miscanthi]|uniref:Arsenate reductase family protein n=1 Tax=Shouchella miscanthi TaxID=2598861 RepID=A0ABU6NM90_9BACI|nr:arsenate reductase family protein [Shouchella miscanthi]
MSVTLYEYPKCGTCRNAKKWLDAQSVSYEAIHIVENPPSAEELKELHQKSGLELKAFFNTSGKKYRELDLKNKRAHMSEQEQYELLASDGMLIKRPIVTDSTKVTLGFKEEQFETNWA